MTEQPGPCHHGDHVWSPPHAVWIVPRGQTTSDVLGDMVKDPQSEISFCLNCELWKQVEKPAETGGC